MVPVLLVGGDLAFAVAHESISLDRVDSEGWYNSHRPERLC